MEILLLLKRKPNALGKRKFQSGSVFDFDFINNKGTGL